ncbi:hypothetical protein E2562_027646 [Oryza meyeriana var. granulata]|uniref:Uncharacterized protein n=1 Tax=Oryza meyeriana var. granulata TaxID=110450 RepID=A0A6G1E2J4_9ORYZ|nr:hypothetical protein E2562_027646 [Oryza meyeriana var. granulata]
MLEFSRELPLGEVTQHPRVTRGCERLGVAQETACACTGVSCTGSFRSGSEEEPGATCCA